MLTPAPRVLTSALAALTFALPVLAQERVERRLSAMGTWLTLEVEAPTRATALAASEAAVRAIEAVEARLSTWSEDSELARLNRAAVGEPFTLSPELAQDLGRARELWRATDGAFDPGVGAFVRAYGLREGGRQPSAEELEAALAAGGFGALALDGTTAVRGRDGLVLEEGAFGKGIGLDAALAALRAAGATSAVVDLGGQLAVLPAPAAARERFAVAHPRDRSEVVVEVEIERGSLSTTGDSERGIAIAGEPRSHIIDPRSGAPAPSFGSVTVWAKDATTADALSTALFVMGPKHGLEWAAAQPGVEALMLIAGEQGELCARATAGFAERATALAEGLAIEVLSSPPAASKSASSGAPVVVAASVPLAAQEDETTEERLARLEEALDAVTNDLERVTLGDVIPPVGDSFGGLGPAASKVYNQEGGLSIGGYGEALFRTFDESSNIADFVRAVLYVGYKFNEDWVLNTEIEVEHTDEIFLEFAYLDYLGWSEALRARAGLLLMPMGFLSEMHEPTTYLTALRPDTERRILPSTWRENGAGIHGDLGPTAYRMYVVNGFDSSGFSDEGLRGGRQGGGEALAEDLAIVARMDYVDVPGLIAGGSVYWGEADQDQLIAGLDPGDNTTSIFELHAEWRHEGLWLRGLGALAEVDDADSLSTALAALPDPSGPVGEEMEGFYVEAGYDLMQLTESESTLSISPYVRWETIDTQAEMPAGFTADPANDDDIMTYGINISPIPKLVFKLDYNDRDEGEDGYNLAMGYVF